MGWVALLLLFAAVSVRAAGQLLREVEFTEYTQLSSNAEILRRVLSPLAAARLARQLADAGHSVAGQAVKLTDERFSVYVPARPPARGYGVLVFVPPWQDARLPRGWEAVLDTFGLIFVTAARSGNDESTLGRREPLALLAAHNIAKRYPVDPDRIYVAGFSGGSRVALRLALAFPDVFRGAILNAGSDPIGNRELPLPAGSLLARAQDSSRFVYVTGEQDAAHANEDVVSTHSLRHWCLFNVDHFLEPRAPHEVATAAAFRRALDELVNLSPPDTSKLSACRSALETEVARKLDSVAALIQQAQVAKAQRLLREVDDEFGGFAAPRSLDLATRLSESDTRGQ